MLNFIKSNKTAKSLTNRYDFGVKFIVVKPLSVMVWSIFNEKKKKTKFLSE